FIGCLVLYCPDRVLTGLGPGSCYVRRTTRRDSRTTASGNIQGAGGGPGRRNGRGRIAGRNGAAIRRDRRSGARNRARGLGEAAAPARLGAVPPGGGGGNNPGTPGATGHTFC